jgi:hypothetical protein
MTTPLDVSMEALGEVAAEAAAKADAEACAAGLKPAGLLKRLRSRLTVAKPLAKGIGRIPDRGATKPGRLSTGRVSARRKLGA